MELLPFSDYAKKEMEAVSARLSQKPPHGLRFAFLTDLHYKFITEMRQSLSNIIHTLNALHETDAIDFLCLGGDNVGNYPNSREEHIAMMQELADLLKNAKMPVICVQGNHDDNSIHCAIENTHTCRTGFEVPDDIQHDILFTLASGCEHYHPADNKALYGYLDIPHADTRVVFLNSSNVPYILDGDIMRYNQQWDFGYTGKQLDWLTNTALKNAPKNVFFIEHSPFETERTGSEPKENEDALNAITRAFANGESLHITREHADFGYDIKADFSGEKHNVPARIGGHCHFDSCGIDPCGFFSITTMLGGRKNSGMHVGDDGVMYPRERYTETETSVDIFTFDPDEYTLISTRYGSGVDRNFKIK